MNPQLPPTMPADGSEPYSMYVLLLVVISALFVIVLPEILSWRRRRQVRSEHDNVLRKNVKRRCRDCGRPVMTDVFSINPSCILCQDKER